MNNFTSFIITAVTGDNAKKLAEYDNNSKKKAVTLTLAAFLPAIIWLISGILIGINIYQLSRSKSLLLGVVLAGIILLLESVLMRSGKSKLLSSIRILLGFCIAVFGSIFIDTILFDSDIKTYAIKQYKEEQESKLLALDKQLEIATQVFYAEIDGVGGSKRRGYDVNAKKKEADKESLALALREGKEALATDMVILHDQTHIAHHAKLEALGLQTIFHRLSIFHKLIKEDNVVLGTAIVFMFIMFFLEILPIIYKTQSKLSAFELDMQAQELLMDKRRKQTLAMVDYHSNLREIRQQLN